MVNSMPCPSTQPVDTHVQVEPGRLATVKFCSLDHQSQPTPPQVDISKRRHQNRLKLEALEDEASRVIMGIGQMREILASMPSYRGQSPSKYDVFVMFTTCSAAMLCSFVSSMLPVARAMACTAPRREFPQSKLPHREANPPEAKVLKHRN